MNVCLQTDREAAKTMKKEKDSNEAMTAFLQDCLFKSLRSIEGPQGLLKVLSVMDSCGRSKAQGNLRSAADAI
jgi:hypothetical protein